MSEVKYMNIKDFRELGYLFEVNRQFFHPLGLALEIQFNEDGTETIGGVWDYRDDEEGIAYSESIVRSKEAFKKYQYVNEEKEKFKVTRKERLGFEIQPILHSDENDKEKKTL